MYYDFIDHQENVISEHSNKEEMMREVREYYKGVAIDNENEEFEIDGFVRVINQFGEVVKSDKYYRAGQIRPSKNVSPYLQSEFI